MVICYCKHVGIDTPLLLPPSLTPYTHSLSLNPRYIVCYVNI